MLHLRLLGTFEAQVEGEMLKLPSLPRTVPLWTYLLLNSAAPVRRELLAQLLWPDEGEELGRANLRRHLHKLQLALPPAPTTLPWLLTTPTTIQWNPAADYWLDTDEFERLAHVPERLEDAVALYNGELLAGWYDEWLFPERERLQRLYLATLDQLVEQHRARLDYPAAIRYAHQLLTCDPFNEAGLRQLLRLNYELGDRASALREYGQFIARLTAELGIEPMAETRMLHEAILHHRPLPGADAANIALATASAGLVMLPLVGREQELAQLERVWAEGARGKGGLVLVAGEAGIGKSRLTAELANKAERGGARVLCGGSSYAEPLPYQALVTALRPALPLLAALDSVAPLRAVLPLLPELAHRRPDLTPLPPIDPHHEQQRLYQGLADCLAELAAPRPLLLILEDLHWAGAATIELLHYLGERIGNQRLLIVGTYREEEVARQHPLRELRRMAVQADRERYLPLVRLDEAAVGELARQIPNLPGGDEAVARQLYAESEGNPFFLSELIREWGEHPSEEHLARRMPGGVASLILARVAQLGPNPRLLAEVAAVGGVGFNLELLGEVTGWDEGSLLGTLDELLDKGLVREAGGMQGYDYSFSHHLVQEAIYAQMSDEVRSRRHRRLGLVMEEMYPQRHEEMASELARHFDLGAAPERAVSYYLKAGGQSQRVYAVEEALAALARVLELSADPYIQFEAAAQSESIYHRQGKREAQAALLAQMNEIADELDDDNLTCQVLHRRIALHDALGEREAQAALIDELASRAAISGNRQWQAVAFHLDATLKGQLSRYDEAQLANDVAIRLYQEIAERDALVACYCLSSELYNMQGRLDEARQLLEQARTIASPHSQLLLVKTLKASIVHAIAMYDHKLLSAASEELLVVCRSISDRANEAYAHTRIAVALSWQKEIVAALEQYQQARELYTLANDQAGLALAMNGIAVMLMELHHNSEADTWLEQAALIRQTLGDIQGQVTCIINNVYNWNLAGNYTAARDAGWRGLALDGLDAIPFFKADLLINLGVAEVELGEFTAAIEHEETAITLKRQAGVGVAQLARDLSRLTYIYMMSGEPKRALRSIKEALAYCSEDEQLVRHNSADIFWSATQVYHALADQTQTREYLNLAYQAFEQQAPTEAETHAVYFANHRDLIAAYERDEWPAYAQPPQQGTNEVATREMPICPTCQQADVVVKAGLRSSGSQRYRCQRCQRYFTAQSRSRGYAAELRQQAIALHQGGAGVRPIARELGVSPQTVSNWLASVPSTPAD